MTFDFGWDDTTELHEAVLQALGAASVCWDFDTHIFQSDRAEAIGDALLDFINARFMPVPPATAYPAVFTVSGELLCAWCGGNFSRVRTKGPAPRYCSKAHREAAYRSRLVARAHKGETARTGLPVRVHQVITDYLIRDGIEPSAALEMSMDIVRLLKEELWSE